MPVAIQITKEAINALPLTAFAGPVSVIRSDRQLPAALQEMRGETILGFDTESRPSFRKGDNYPVALLQLGGANHVWLFQLLKLTDLAPLWRVLSNPRIIKAGVAIQDDIRKLQELRPFKPGGFVEISHFTQRAGILNTGLRSLAALLLHTRISKRAQVTNWARSELTKAQVQYAATDAWVSRELYLVARELPAAPMPPKEEPPQARPKPEPTGSADAAAAPPGRRPRKRGRRKPKPPAPPPPDAPASQPESCA